MSLLPPHLQAFLAVARIGTVHGAATELGLTQTGVTQRLRSIEAELGTTLFLRSRKGMALTEEGEALLRYCRSAEDLSGLVLSHVKDAGQVHERRVAIAGPTSAMTSRVVDQCLPLYAKWPELYLDLKIEDETNRLNLTRTGQAAFAIVPPEQVPNEMDSKKLKPDRYLLVGSPKWRGRRISEILEHERVIDFDESDPTTLNYLKKHGLVAKLKRPRLFVNNNEAIAKFFCRGVGFGTLTHEVARSYLESGKLIALNGGAAMEDPLALVWYPRPMMPEYFKAIVEAIK